MIAPEDCALRNRVQVGSHRERKGIGQTPEIHPRPPPLTAGVEREGGHEYGKVLQWRTRLVDFTGYIIIRRPSCKIYNVAIQVLHIW